MTTSPDPRASGPDHRTHPQSTQPDGTGNPAATASHSGVTPHGTTPAAEPKNSKGLLWALAALAALVIAALLIWLLVRHHDDAANAAGSTSSSASSAASSISAAASAPDGGSAEPSSTQLPGADGTPYTVQGAILAKYQGLDDATRKDLGAPTGNEQTNPDGGVFQQFDGGVIAFKTKAYIVWGKIRDKWNELGGSQGQMGYPTSDEHDAPNGEKRSTFEHGVITWFAPGGGDTTVTPN